MTKEEFIKVQIECGYTEKAATLLWEQKPAEITDDMVVEDRVRQTSAHTKRTGGMEQLNKLCELLD